jgi:ParB family chromosome partitioning protein
LLDLPEFVRQSLMRGDINMGHARAVAAAPDPEDLTREIVKKGLSVRQAEARAKRAKRGGSELVLGKSNAIDPDLAALERQLGDMLGVRVQVAHKGQGGTVSLHYSSLDQLDMICQRLTGEPI